MLKLNINIVVKQIDNGYLLINNKTNEIYQISDIGFNILLKLCDNITKEDIISFLMDNYAVDKKTATSDIEELYKDYLNANILVESDERS